MKAHRTVSVGLVVAFLLAFAAAAVWADHDRRDGHRRDGDRERERGFAFDARHRHNRYYPPRGHIVRALPPDRHVAHHRGMNYYFHGGVWYRPSGARFSVVLPPVGIVVPVLPPFYSTIWVGSVPYYYADDVYYVWRPEARGYVVTEPPPESEVRESAAMPDELFIYPAQGQGEQQQATDRYECHRWSAEQTGYDPTRPGGAVPEGESSDKRADYQRAMKACLEARGYSVQ